MLARHLKSARESLQIIDPLLSLVASRVHAIESPRIPEGGMEGRTDGGSPGACV